MHSLPRHISKALPRANFFPESTAPDFWYRNRCKVSEVVPSLSKKRSSKGFVKPCSNSALISLRGPDTVDSEKARRLRIAGPFLGSQHFRWGAGFCALAL